MHLRISGLFGELKESTIFYLTIRFPYWKLATPKVLVPGPVFLNKFRWCLAVSEEISLVLSPAMTVAESSQDKLIHAISAQVALVPATPEDQEFLYRTYAGTRAEEMALTGWNSEQQSAFLRMQFDAQRRSYSSEFPQAEYGIIKFDGEPVGRLIVDRSKDEILLIDIALLPQFRLQGIGSELMSRLMQEAARTNKRIRLHVERFNPILPWYQSLGFQTISESAIYLEMTWKAKDPQTEPCI